jgi:hypothetical protein
MDPEKRRRIQVRFAHEKDIPMESLQWCFPIILSPADFYLPDVGSVVFVLRFNDIYMWMELPDKTNWSHISDDDYPTAEMHKHKDVYEYEFKQSDGFRLLMNHLINGQIKNLMFHVNEDFMYFYFDEYGYRQTNTFIEIGKLAGGNSRITLNLSNGEIVFNDNRLGSYITDINKLVERMNIIEQDINQIKDFFAQWVPIPFDGGAALKAISSPWHSNPLVETTVPDIKDNLIKN